jgi:hypothetical protein
MGFLFSLIAISAVAVNAQDGRYVGCGLLVGKEGFQKTYAWKVQLPPLFKRD